MSTTIISTSSGRTGTRHRPAVTAGIALLALLLAVGALREPSTAAAAHDVRAEATLDWLSAELATNGGTFPGFAPGSTDWGITADAALAFLAAGRRDDPTTVIVTDRLLAALADYTTWDDIGSEFTGVRLAGPLAKVALVAAEQGRDLADPATADGLTLEAELRALVRLDGAQRGRVSDRNPYSADASNGFGQALAIMALSNTPDGVPDSTVDFLLAQQCPDGGFRLFVTATDGCVDAAESDVDTTALSLQALSLVERSAAVEQALGRGLRWLLDRQDGATGGFGGTGPTAALNANSTGLAAQTLRALGQDVAAERAAAWVAGSLLLDSDLSAGTPAQSDVGAIAYDPPARATALATGITSGSRDQWRRSTTQAVSAFSRRVLGVPVSSQPIEPSGPPTTAAPPATAAPPNAPPTTAAPTTAVPTTAVPTAPSNVDPTDVRSTGLQSGPRPASSPRPNGGTTSAAGGQEVLARTGSEPRAPLGVALTSVGAGLLLMALTRQAGRR